MDETVHLRSTDAQAAFAGEALLLDGGGAARRLSMDELAGWAPGHGQLWVDLPRGDPHLGAWLRERALEPLAIEALLAEETRPRWLAVGDGLLIILRGVNLNPGADPEDMVSLRLWLEPETIYSIHARPVAAVSEVRAALLAGKGPAGARDLLVALAERLVARMAPTIEELDDQADALEDSVLQGIERHELPTELADLRRTAIRLRRHLAPQREVLIELAAGEARWLRDVDQQRLSEIADRITRYVESLDLVREHAAVTQEELHNRTVQRTARTTYLLTAMASLFLPLTFVTGLLGINVDGIPGAGSSWAFTIVCALLAALAALELWLLRRLGWL